MAQDDPALRVVWALRRAFLAVEAAKDARLRVLGVSNAQYGLLMNVRNAPGVTNAELARRLRVTPQNLTTLVARVEQHGWVQRREHARHAHVRELFLTADGERVLRSAEAEVTAVESLVRDHLGARETERLRATLDRLADLGGADGRDGGRPPGG